MEVYYLNKKELRKKYYELRNQMTEQEVSEKSHKIMERLVKSQWYGNAGVIMTYVGFNKEVDTKEFIRYALKNGKKIVVPITDMRSGTLLLSEIKDFDTELEVGTYGILEPKKEYVSIVEDETVDLVIVPGLVFDLRGYRIGYGGGFYDKLLERFKHQYIAIGVAFDFQVVNCIPAESYDKSVAHIITEERIISI